MREIHRSPVNSPHKGQWRRALISSLICAWTNSWANNREARDLRRHNAITKQYLEHIQLYRFNSRQHLSKYLAHIDNMRNNFTKYFSIFYNTKNVVTTHVACAICICVSVYIYTKLRKIFLLYLLLYDGNPLKPGNFCGAEFVITEGDPWFRWRKHSVTVAFGFQLKVKCTLDISLYIFSKEFRRDAA